MLRERSGTIRDWQERYREMQFQELKDIYRDFVKEERLSAEQERNFYQLLVDQKSLEYFIEDDKFMQDLAQIQDPAATPTPRSRFEREAAFASGR